MDTTDQQKYSLRCRADNLRAEIKEIMILKDEVMNQINELHKKMEVYNESHELLTKELIKIRFKIDELNYVWMRPECGAV